MVEKGIPTHGGMKGLVDVRDHLIRRRTEHLTVPMGLAT